MKKSLLSIIIYLFIFHQTLAPQNLELIGNLPSEEGEFITDVWGYVHPSGKEYAIMGASGIEIIDISDPVNPQRVFNSNSYPGFDMKIWKNYLYLVTGSGGANLGKILDITDPSNPELVGSFNSSHNIFISDNGYLFAESPSLVVYNLNNTPANPEFVWSSESGGGHDATVIKNIIYDFHGSAGTNIYEFDISNEFSVQLLGSITNPLVQYHHSGWTTSDDNYLFICDEGANHPTPDITVWDIRNPSEPSLVDQYADPDATVHNLYIIGDYAFVSYYTSGFRIFDISDPTDIKVTAHYDTSPATGQGFNGAFGVYPFLPSGNILVSDQTGLYIFKFNQPTDVNEKGSPVSFKLQQNYPNPFNPSTTISFDLPFPGFVSLKVYDLLGNEIVELINQKMISGNHYVEFSADDYINLSSGIYFYEIRAGDFISNKKMILLK